MQDIERRAGCADRQPMHDAFMQQRDVEAFATGSASGPALHRRHTPASKARCLEALHERREQRVGERAAQCVTCAVTRAGRDDLQRGIAREIEIDVERAFEMREHDAARFVESRIGRDSRRDFKRIDGAELAQRIEMTRIAQDAGGWRCIGCDAAQLICIRTFGGHSGQRRELVDSQFERARVALRREQLAQLAFEQAGMMQE